MIWFITRFIIFHQICLFSLFKTYHPVFFFFFQVSSLLALHKNFLHDINALKHPTYNFHVPDRGQYPLGVGFLLLEDLIDDTADVLGGRGPNRLSSPVKQLLPGPTQEALKFVLWVCN